MKLILPVLLFTSAISLLAQSQMGRVADDARVIDRVAEASHKDLPTDLLRRVVNEDIELLRGKRADGTYQHAGYERMEAARSSESFSVDSDKKETVMEIRGAFVYRLLINVPSRRLLVTKNRRVYVDRVEIEIVPQSGTARKTQVAKIGAWIEPGSSQTVDFDEIARQATVRVFAHGDEAGYGNVSLILTEARIFDDPTSPFADAVSSEKAILRALEKNDIPSIRAMAQRIASTMAPVPTAAIPGRPSAPTMEVVAPKADAEIYPELQAIEDLLTGSDVERRQGLDRLHQLVRRLRGTRSDR